MPFLNYSSTTLRASAATSGTSEQDAAVTLPESVSEIWVVVEKTAEANANNLLTVRLQSRVDSTWLDVAWDSLTPTTSLTTAADTVADVTRAANIEDASDDSTFTRIAHFKTLPSNVVRVISVSSGTTVASTFSAVAYFRLNRF